ncbi:MAG: Sua5/YciO/YrdC/YwlC family protein, partial [Planctomycetes bacterium]|nr:Sua5/YciO/YrdC/YwlC family protein [Planctomycetota bacterium]
MPCERRPLATADRALLIGEVCDRLRAGELCALPTETVYGLAVLPDHPDATARLRALLARGPERP